TVHESPGPASYGTLRAANPTASRYPHTSRRFTVLAVVGLAVGALWTLHGLSGSVTSSGF
ncbi:hypothetical protein, partial [Streptomyces sp. NPDC052107]|uniref:hypothetical protein n=1 Tax=Streptomyces sp. NPDC052107 TaxID=3155632 RepID=UPI003449A1FB